MVELLEHCEAVVVVGDSHSNNTLQLVRLAEVAGKPVQRVNSLAELDRDWVARFQVIGLTAGTSAPDAVIDAVHQQLLAIGTTPAKLQRERGCQQQGSQISSFSGSVQP